MSIVSRNNNAICSVWPEIYYSKCWLSERLNYFQIRLYICFYWNSENKSCIASLKNLWNIIKRDISNNSRYIYKHNPFFIFCFLLYLLAKMIQRYSCLNFIDCRYPSAGKFTVKIKYVFPIRNQSCHNIAGKALFPFLLYTWIIKYFFYFYR